MDFISLRLREIKAEPFDPSDLLTSSEIKVEPVDPSSDMRESATPERLPSNVQMKNAELFGRKFDTFKSEVCQQLTANERDIEIESGRRWIAEVELRIEVTHRQRLELKIQELTRQNETLTKETNDLKEELQQSRDNNKRLQDELDLKEFEMADVKRQLKRKSASNRNFKDQLACFLNNKSSSDTDDNEETHSAVAETSGQTDKKRSMAFDTSTIQDENKSTSKRFKGTTVLITDVQRSISDLGSTMHNTDVVEENDTENCASPSDDNVEPDGNDDVIANRCLDVMLHESPVKERKSRCADNSDLAFVIYKNPISDKPRSVRKNIKEIMGYDTLEPETKQAYLQEKERKSRYVRRLQKYNEIYGKLPGELNSLDQIIFDFDLNTKAELLSVDKRLSIKLKPHQCEGVKFMWDACFESIEKLQRSNGGGCILSHCMGLGKTLQVITLVHTLLTHSLITKVSRVLIICPVNVILNWVDEFDLWLKAFSKHESLNIYELVSNPDERTNQLRHWYMNGGVLIVGYKMFQLMYNKMEQRSNNILYNAFFDPGADLVVCDEGHLLKNPSSQLSVTVNKIRTRRRIVLTGTPLQNNLKEYFAMVEFVKPRLLGTEREFNNRFVGPIVNGQFVNSTDEDTTLMKRRAYILHKLLEGCVHRRDYSVLAQFLPPKEEYVLFIRLTEDQIELYKHYMMTYIRSQPITDLPPLRRICNHPMVLGDFENRSKYRPSTKSQKNDEEADGAEPDEKWSPNKGWWRPICSGEQLEMSNKMVILMNILNQCEKRNEKLVVFSGCLSTLNVIEHFLAKISKSTADLTSSTDYKGVWKRDVDYSRLDGGQTAEKRKRDVTRFNKETNARTRLFLISTKAGSLGINLMAANRVIIFDASWNPSDDIQSIFRVYRIGQLKRCFIYRFIALGTMEEKIYDRQVSKLSIAKRVIDEHQICRHYREEDLQQLYSIDNLDPPTKRLTIPTEDGLLNSIFQRYGDIVYKHHDHDSLLENVVEETLREEDVGDFWDMFH